MATELGKAYVQIVPSAQGISGSISGLLDGEASSAGDRAGQSLGGSLIGKLKGVMAAAGIGKIISDAVNAGGELEQNLGGTEAVFGEFAGKIQDSAYEAYKNMGMSASDYMATANKMGALFQGSGLEQQKAMDLTSEAMQRAADVASVMGLDTTAAMESIAGAAKGNFTMMDNLGVAMNAAAIESYALEKGINFEWKTASQAEKTEVAMKMFMDRTSQYAGNFARESEETFSGSLGSMKSAFTNLLADLAAGNDIDRTLQAFSSTLTTFADNLLPMLTDIISQIPMVIANLLMTAGPDLVTAGMEAITNIITGIANAIPRIVPMIVEGISGILNALLDAAPDLIDAGLQLILNLGEGLIEAIPQLIAKVPEIITKLVSAITDTIPKLIETGFELLTSLVQDLPNIIQAVVKAIPEIIKGLVEGITKKTPDIVKQGVELLTSLVKDLPNIITTIVKAIPEIIVSIINALVENAPDIIQAGFELLTSLVTDLPNIIMTIVAAVPEIISGIVSAFADGIGQIVEIGKNIAEGLWEGIKSAGSWVKDKVVGWANDLWGGVKNFFGISSPAKLFIWAGEMIDAGLAGGITDNVGIVDRAMKELEDSGNRTFASDFDLSLKSSQSALNASLQSGMTITGDREIVSTLQDILDAIKTIELRGDVLLDGNSIVGKLVRRMDEALAAKQIAEEFGGGKVASLG